MSEIAERELLLKLKVNANELRKLGAVMGKTQKQIRKSLEPVTQKIRDQQLAVEKASLAAKKGKVEFAGYAMSIMFAGMALKRMFDSIWKFGTKTFEEISNSVENSTNGFTLLQGSMKYLGFTIGAALEPVAMWLIPIIDKIGDWVNRHEKLTKVLLITIGIIGTVLMVSGMLKLAWDGIHGTIIAVSAVMKGIKLMKFGALITQIRAIGIAWSNASLAGKLGFLGVIGGIILAIMWIFKLKNAIGGWGEFFKSVLRGVLRILVAVGDFIVTALVTPIQIILGLTAKAMDWLGMGTPQWMKDFVQWQPDFLEKYIAKESSGWLAPEQGYATGRDGVVPTFNINTLNVTADNADEFMAEIDRFSNTT